MVTGHVLFRGSPAEVMYQHQHAPLPLEQLESVSQPVVSLIEVLLDKDPKRRFQTPADLLKALPTITGAIDEGRAITYQSHCVKFTFREFSEAIPPLQLTFSEPEERCCWF